MPDSPERLNNLGHNVHSAILQSSNLTSSHFLGTVPRGWMLDRRNTLGLDGAAPNQLQIAAPRIRPVNTISHHTPPIQLPNASQNSLPSTTELPNSQPSNALAFTLPPHRVPVQHDFQSSVQPFNANGDALLGNSGASQSAQPSVAFHNMNRIGGPQPSPMGRGELFIETPSMSPQIAAPNFQTLGLGAVNEPTAAGRDGSISAAETSPSVRRMSRLNHGGQFRVQDQFRPSIPTATSPLSMLNRSSAVLPSIHATASPPARTYNQSDSFMTSEPMSSLVPMTGQVSSTGRGTEAISNMLPVAQPCTLRILNRKIAAVEAKKPLNAIDLIRVTWLRGACQHGDMFYLILHQLSCIQIVSPQFLASHLPFLPYHTAGLNLLSQILADNRHITVEVMTEFCNFVVPLPDITTDKLLQSWIPQTKTLLENFVDRWSLLRMKVFARGTPPSAQEVVEDLGVEAPVLSQAFYVSFFYQLFPQADKDFSEKGFGLYKVSQDSYLKRKQEEPSSHHISGHRELQLYVAGFREIANAHQQRPLKTFKPVYRNVDVRPQKLAHASNQTFIMRPTTVLNVPGPGLENRQFPQTTAAAPATLRTPSGITREMLADRRPQLAPPAVSRVFPDPGQLIPVTVNPDTKRSALHQAHLLNPVLAPEKPPDGDLSVFRMYSFLERFTSEPKVITSKTVFESWSVTVPSELFKSKIHGQQISASNPFGRSVRVIRSGSVFFHLRCVRVDTMKESIDEAECSATATYWPEHLFVSINRIHLEYRRRILHGRDLPVDVTDLLQEENELHLSYYCSKSDIDKKFAIVIEAIRVLNHPEVMNLPGSVDADASLHAMTQLLRNTNDDDDVVMADSHISVDIIDPFSARIFTQPVRGKSCRHRECFDLEAFLQSRTCRYKDGLVQPDEWRCPMCGRDARPSSLVVDHFLLKVKDKLLADGKSETKAILIREDGSWESKSSAPEALESESTDTFGEQQRARSPSNMIDTKTLGSIPIQAHSLTPSVQNPGVIIVLDEED